VHRSGPENCQQEMTELSSPDGMLIEAFTDGGCSGNPGPGGWAYHLTVHAGRVAGDRPAPAPAEGSGAAARTTNNRMELTAVIQALRAVRALPEHTAARVVVATDSTYVQQGITSWIRRWRANGWRTATKQPVKNAELWRTLDELARETGAQFRWVRGHAGDPRNERCDTLVQAAIATARRRAALP
jgi:ribonuclease HI